MWKGGRGWYVRDKGDFLNRLRYIVFHGGTYTNNIISNVPMGGLYALYRVNIMEFNILNFTSIQPACASLCKGENY